MNIIYNINMYNNLSTQYHIKLRYKKTETTQHNTHYTTRHVCFDTTQQDVILPTHYITTLNITLPYFKTQHDTMHDTILQQ